MTDVNVILKRFESPDEVREFDNGRFEIIRIGGITIGRASYQPGWKWSVHVGGNGLRVAGWSTSGWSFQAAPPPPWTMAA